MSEHRPTLWTVGHSTRSLEGFLAVLNAYGLQTLADVRRFPGSRRLPHFNQAPLAAALQAAGLGYLHLPELGGRRSVRPDSTNQAWRNRSFRGYADHLETAEFASGIERLLSAARQAPTAIMCAELLWWRCHRSLIADYLKAAGHEVIHIADETKAEAHPYTAVARLLDGRLSYSAGLPART